MVNRPQFSGGFLDVFPRFCHTPAMTSFRQTVAGVISAFSDRCQPKSDFLSSVADP